MYTPKGARKAILQYIGCFLKYQGRDGRVIRDRIALELGEGTAFAEERSGYNWERLVKKWWRLKKHQRRTIVTGEILPLSRQPGKVSAPAKMPLKPVLNVALYAELPPPPSEQDVLRG